MIPSDLSKILTDLKNSPELSANLNMLSAAAPILTYQALMAIVAELKENNRLLSEIQTAGLLTKSAGEALSNASMYHMLVNQGAILGSSSLKESDKLAAVQQIKELDSKVKAL